MKRKIGIALFLAAVLTLSLLSFTACGSGSGIGGKQVPVYQGMTITRTHYALSLASENLYASGVTPLGENNGNNGNRGYRDEYVSCKGCNGYCCEEKPC